jgi:hypothetical protein
MTPRALALSLALVVAAGGCEAPDGGLPTVGGNQFAAAPAGPPPTVARAPASEAVARRVSDVSQRLLAGNADLPVRPLFLPVGSADPEVFHKDAKEGSVIFISDGLANRCTSDAQLAAVLCSELGKLVSTREAVLALKARRPERDPPVALRIGQDSGGTFGSADGVGLAERANFEKAMGGTAATAPLPPPPNPDLLARTYLAKAGFAAADLDSVAPLLREAEKNNDLEKQLTAPIRPNVPR